MDDATRARVERKRDELTTRLYSADPSDQADAYEALRMLEATEQPARTKWPAARHLQQAADMMREPDLNLDPEREHYTAPLGDWLDKVANEMAWLAPYREHEGGYRPWRAATRAAHGVLGLPDADTCSVCHTRRR